MILISLYNFIIISHPPTRPLLTTKKLESTIYKKPYNLILEKILETLQSISIYFIILFSWEGARSGPSFKITQTPFTWGYFVFCWNWSVVLEKIGNFYNQSCRHIYALRHLIHPGSMDLQQFSFFFYLLISIVNMNKKLFCDQTLEIKERQKNN